MTIKTFIPLFIFFITLSNPTFAQSTEDLSQKIQEIVANKQARVGVSIWGSQGQRVELNVNDKYPLQSVFKYHIALAVLAKVDKGELRLEQEVEIKPHQLLPGLWSPLRDAHPNGGIFTIAELIRYIITVSDNVGCDALLRVVGGTDVVESFFKSHGINDLGIKLNEEQMQADWDRMYENWTTPNASNLSLQKFYDWENPILSAESYAFFWQTMAETQTGLARLKAQLPPETLIAHKTGSSGTNDDGITEAVNDMGIIFLPNGNYFIISVFVSSSKENSETNEKIIADIAKLTYDFFAN